MKQTKESSSKPAVGEAIEVFGARVHNLRNIDISIPKNELVVITGISGSGKSSLAFDTIYAEGQRRYMETFGAYARQFIGDMERPDVDKITGLSPVISIEQKTTNKNPRSTVGTITEVYDFFRLLYARVGEAYSYNTGKKMVKWSEEEIVADIFKKYDGKKISLLAPLIRGRKGHYRELFEDIRKKGFLKVRIDGEVTDIVPKMQVDRYKIHDIELVVDRMQVTDDMRTRLSQSVQSALKLGKDLLFLLVNDQSKVVQYSKLLMCEDTGISYEEPSPNSFSFNSPYGACPVCKGLGTTFHVNHEAVIPDTSLSISEGGIAPLGEEREAHVYKQMQDVAKKNKISLTKAIKDLPPASLNILLYGNAEGNESEIDFENYQADADAPYEGIIHMLKRWFNNGYSEGLREWAEGYMQLMPCESCGGARLKKESLWFKIDGRNVSELSAMNLDNLAAWLDGIELRLENRQKTIGKDILKEIRERLQFLLDVGLTYLTLDRSSKTLSGGESQRIRLATQIGSQLQGITYILDEPSIGLHQRDNHRLIEALKNLRDIGNSVLVVEHDKDIMLAADYLIDVGPKAGHHGGQIVAQGKPSQLLKLDTITAGYLNGKRRIEVPAERRKGNGKFLELKGANGNNLQKVNVKFPLGKFIVVSGVSGSGKSTLINETLYPILSHHAFGTRITPLEYKSIKGLEHIDKVIEIDQSPIGRTPRSNPATYCGFFTEIRTLFASIPEAKIRGYNAGRFSFNVKSGRCEVCEGGGMRVIEMNFLPDVYVPCEKCNGKRYNRETLEIRYKGKSIADVLEMTVEEAVEFFQPVPFLYRKIKVLEEVGLGYITLGQSAVTLSGGEAQRVKLSTELAKRDTGKTFYILDEPTTGLHFEDIRHLLDVLQKLVDRGNSVLVIEHNMDVIKVADHVIDMGPEGGDGGGKLLFEGTPEELAKHPESHTARFLKEELR
ncbi:MAG: excinuclease ABC subunit A [Sphingobacteriales bacterium SCN 48-20]|jgi:excinuclease ABC subunit A|uniref:excinuclease ABC subunit UvrA n=1 Tax=Terrimonas ferruginea TaxID=249 RepID=UPI00086E41A4|nr:excinuclease ABC subunit UvrA [Terrimonas ferruginea]MBN8783197.1 excinuclease ABC subunit UvrA [Terrimonas ferruginea]ODT91773.1 MAG: excinuclease ABC subunit A [Sphingobacteriales bacterium SCN 48-20]OJW39818.1 MAG: excinuclease ABC subunit A [Sphingobacteriales bacterium 48-107]